MLPTKKRRGPELSTRSAAQLAHALKRWRTEAALTQEELALRAGVRQGTISKMEKGAGATTARTIYAICAALDLELIVRARPPSVSLQPEDF